MSSDRNCTIESHKLALRVLIAPREVRNALKGSLEQPVLGLQLLPHTFQRGNSVF